MDTNQQVADVPVEVVPPVNTIEVVIAPEQTIIVEMTNPTGEVERIPAPQEPAMEVDVSARVIVGEYPSTSELPIVPEGAIGVVATEAIKVVAMKAIKAVAAEEPAKEAIAVLPMEAEDPSKMAVDATTAATLVLAEDVPKEAAVPEDPTHVGVSAATAVLRKQKGGRRKAVRTTNAASAQAAAAATTPKKKAISGRFLDKTIKTRRGKGFFYHSHLFKCNRSDLINADGDIRHFDCETVAQIGPFAPGTKLEVIDWLGSANLLFASATGKIADTIVLALSNATIESQVPIEP